jgi:hypothetical protein
MLNNVILLLIRVSPVPWRDNRGRSTTNLADPTVGVGYKGGGVVDNSKCHARNLGCLFTPDEFFVFLLDVVSLNYTSLNR